ncbi:MAG: transposase [Kangiellaceae bacterium]
MPRLQRFGSADVVQHIIQCGNIRPPYSCEKQVFGVYTAFLKSVVEKYQVDIHVWCFMTNHVYLLITPKRADAVSHRSILE